MSTFQLDKMGNSLSEVRLFAIDETTFKREVLQSNKLVLVHFWAPWCGLCRLILPLLEKFQAEREREIKLVTINADENFKLATAYRLANLPTLLIFKDGKLVQKLDDFKSRDGLQLILEKLASNISTAVDLKIK